MTEQQYRRVSDAIRGHAYGPLLVKLLDKLIAIIIFALYPVYLGSLYLTGMTEYLLPSVVVPGAGFIAVSIFRATLNAKRPYEVYDFEPLIQKETLGHSLPSRHVFSAAIIGMTFLQTDFQNGMALLILAAILGMLRVVGGVHFPKDVIAGFVSAVVWGLIGFWIIF